MQDTTLPKLFSGGAKHRGFPALTLFIAIASLIYFNEPSFSQTIPSTQSYPSMSPDDLPDAALHGDLFAVAVIDLKLGDKTAWNNALMVVTGGKPTTRPLGPNDPLPLGADQSLGPLFKIGVERIAESFALRNKDTIITLCFRLSPDANANDADAWLSKNIPGSRHFEHEGNWLVVRANANGGAAPAVPPLNPRADDIRQDINCWGEDVPVKLVFISSNTLKQQALAGGQPPEVLRGILNLLWSSNYLFAGAKLGEHPQIYGRWAAPDSDGADAVIKEFAAFRQGLKQPNNGLGVPTFFGTILDQVQPVRDGNAASCTLGQKELTTIFTTLVAASMSNQNNNNNNSGQAFAAQTPVAPDWAPTDTAVDSASAQMRLILAAIAQYDLQHQALPASLADLVTDNLVPGPEVFHDPRTGKDDGFLYVKPDGATKLADLPKDKQTPILYEEKNGQPDPAGLVGYADGKVAMPK